MMKLPKIKINQEWQFVGFISAAALSIPTLLLGGFAISVLLRNIF